MNHLGIIYSTSRNSTNYMVQEMDSTSNNSKCGFLCKCMIYLVLIYLFIVWDCFTPTYLEFCDFMKNAK